MGATAEGAIRGTCAPRRVRLGAVLALAAALFAAPALAGDADLAKFLAKGGREDLAKGDFDAALSKFEKALAEDPKLLEAVFGAGTALEGKKDATAALRRYREFRTAFEAKRLHGTPSKDEIALATKVEARIGALSTSEPELKKLDDAFVARLLDFAKANVTREPALARRAVDLILDLDPAQADAKKLLASLSAGGVAAPPGPAGSAPEAPGARPAETNPIKAVKTWQPLLTEKVSGTHPGWKYAKDGLTIDLKNGMTGLPSTRRPSGTRYVVELEFRVVETYPGDWGVGIAFSKSNAGFWGMSAGPIGFAIFQTTMADNSPLEVKQLKDVGKIPDKTWHRIAVVADKERVTGWWEGTQTIDYASPSGGTWDGDVGIYVAHAKVEVRLFHIGKQE